MSFEFDVLFKLNQSQKELLRKVTLNELKHHIENNSDHKHHIHINDEEAQRLYELLDLKDVNDMGELRVIQLELSGFIRS